MVFVVMGGGTRLTVNRGRAMPMQPQQCDTNYRTRTFYNTRGARKTGVMNNQGNFGFNRS